MSRLPTKSPSRPTPAAGQAGKRPADGNAVAQIQQTTFSGPMPHPALLEGYDRVVPGAAERILAMAEADAHHQRAQEQAALRAMAQETRRGQFFGLLIGLSALAAAVITAYLGHPTVAGVIGGTTVVGLVSVFIIGHVVKA